LLFDNILEKSSTFYIDHINSTKSKVNELRVCYKTLRLLSGMPDQNFENQGFLIENQDFIRIFFFQKQEENQFFSEVQEIFISLLKDKMAMFFLCIKEN